MLPIRMISFGLLFNVLISLYDLLAKKVKRNGLVIECLVIVLMLVSIYLHEIDYLDISGKNDNPWDFILLLTVGITCIITIIVSLNKK